MSRNLRLLGVLALLVFFTDRPAVPAADEPAAKEDTVQKMEAVSVLDAKEAASARYGFSGGTSAMCRNVPIAEVKAYPKFNSKQPLYGVVVFGTNPTDPKAGGKFHFVLDESGEKPPAAEKPEASEKPKTSASSDAVRAPSRAGSTKTKGSTSKSASKTEAKIEAPAKLARPTTERMLFSSRMPASGATYDRLYFDANADLDLTNDPVLKPLKEPPKALPYGQNVRVFESIDVKFDLTPDPGTCAVQVLPLVQAIGPAYAYVTFMPATVRKANIRLGNQEFVAILSSYGIGRLDRPMNTRLQLIPAGETGRPRTAMTPEYLGALRQIDGQYYCFRATPSGDELRFGPYRGDFGALEVGPGGRAITDLGAYGALVSRECFVPLGEPAPLPPKEFPRRFMLPVGDYLPSSLTIQYGRLRFASRVLTAESQGPGKEPPKPPAYGIQIRKDKPCVLEFSGKPAVMFLNPREGQSFKPGDTVVMKAMLTEPMQGIVITGLWDTTQKKADRKYRIGDKDMISPDFARLDPDIVIKDSKGEKVAEGKMPFG